MRHTRKLWSYVFLGSTFAASAGAAYSWKHNLYNADSIGIVRLGRAAITVFNVGLVYKRELYDSELVSDTEEYYELRSQVHQKAAEMLLDLCKANKGVYIKVGQHMAALEYLIPTEYVQTMKVLHSHAPCSSLKDIHSVIKEELRQDVSEIFEDFSSEPQGAASLAQVHKAKLKKNGKIVAVKVQHPAVKGNSFVDMTTMEILVGIASYIFPDFQLNWLVEETKKNIPKELDFIQEADNMKKVKALFKHLPWLKVPDVYDELTTSRVLTMEFVEGNQVNDVEYIQENNIDPIDVTEKLGYLYSEMIFKLGFIHSDPHPGNILIRKLGSGRKAEIILLDHGLYASISNKVKTEYSGLWLAILNNDIKGMRHHSEALGVISKGNLFALFSCMVSGRTWDSIQAGISRTQHTKAEKELFQRHAPVLLSPIITTLAMVNRELLLILKTNDLLRGIEFSLKTENRMSSFITMSKYCVTNVYNKDIQQCPFKFGKFKLELAKQWELFKITMYYVVLSVRTLSLRTFKITLNLL